MVASKLNDKIILVAKNRSLEIPISHLGAVSMLAAVLNIDIPVDDIFDIWLDGNDEIEIDEETMKAIIMFAGLVESGVQINK